MLFFVVYAQVIIGFARCSYQYHNIREILPDNLWFGINGEDEHNFSKTSGNLT